MRLLRLRIANYRGIGSSEVTFGSSGITLVKGPNEVGKTSLGEAIGFLFDYPDSSKHRNVEAIRPTHKDEGPERGGPQGLDRLGTNLRCTVLGVMPPPAGRREPENRHSWFDSMPRRAFGRKDSNADAARCRT